MSSSPSVMSVTLRSPLRRIFIRDESRLVTGIGPLRHVIDGCGNPVAGNEIGLLYQRTPLERKQIIQRMIHTPMMGFTIGIKLKYIYILKLGSHKIRNNASQLGNMIYIYIEPFYNVTANVKLRTKMSS